MIEKEFVMIHNQALRNILIVSLIFNILVSYALYDVKMCSEKKSETIEQLINEKYQLSRL